MKSGIEELSENLHRLLADAEALLKAAAEGANANLDESGKTARATLHRVCGHLRSAREEVTSRAHKLDGAVHANPWRAVLATAVVAFIAGLSVRRR